MYQKKHFNNRRNERKKMKMKMKDESLFPLSSVYCDYKKRPALCK